MKILEWVLKKWKKLIYWCTHVPLLFCFCKESPFVPFIRMNSSFSIASMITWNVTEGKKRLQAQVANRQNSWQKLRRQCVRSVKHIKARSIMGTMYIIFGLTNDWRADDPLSCRKWDLSLEQILVMPCWRKWRAKVDERNVVQILSLIYNE